MLKQVNFFHVLIVGLVCIATLFISDSYFEDRKESSMAVEDYTEVTVDYGETINMGNYESMRFGVSVTRRLQPSESPDDIIDDLTRSVKDTWQKKVDMLTKEANQR